MSVTVTGKCLRVRRAAENELFEADYNIIGDFMMVAFDKMPVLAELALSARCGAIPIRRMVGCWLGRRGHRMSGCRVDRPSGWRWGGGAGKVLADWMVRGEAEINTRGFDRVAGNFALEDHCRTHQG